MLVICLFLPVDGTVLAGAAIWWEYANFHQMAVPASTVPSAGENRHLIIKLKKRSSPSLSGRLIPEGLHIYCQDTTINLINIFLWPKVKKNSSIS